MGTKKNLRSLFPDVSGDAAGREAFLSLADRCGGFEMEIGFKGFDRHYIGGKNGKVWYMVCSGSKCAYYVSTLTEAGFTGRYYESTGKAPSLSEEAEAERALALAAGIAFYGQAYVSANPRSPMQVENEGCACKRYNYSFGAVAYDVSDEYGVTMRFSDCDREELGYRTFSIRTGKKVKLPPEA